MANTSTAAGFNEVFKNSPFFTAGETTFGKQLKLTNKTPIVDVYSKLPWRAQNGPNPAELEIPYILMTEYEIKISGLLANINTMLDELKSKGADFYKDIYKKLYVADQTHFIYKIPWLIAQGTTLMSSNNKWSDENTSNPFSGLGAMISNLTGGNNKNGKSSKVQSAAAGLTSLGADLVKGSVGGINGLDSVSYYDSSTKRSVDISFPLYNTLDHKSAFENYNFVLLLTFQNTMTRTSLVTHIPPKIYEVRTGGIGGVFMTAAYISNLNITNIGTTRLLNATEFGHVSSPILIPEAYKISFTLTDLLPPSTQLLAEANGGSAANVSVIMPFSKTDIDPTSLINKAFAPQS